MQETRNSSWALTSDEKKLLGWFDDYRQYRFDRLRALTQEHNVIIGQRNGIMTRVKGLLMANTGEMLAEHDKHLTQASAEMAALKLSDYAGSAPFFVFNRKLGDILRHEDAPKDVCDAVKDAFAYDFQLRRSVAHSDKEGITKIYTGSYADPGSVDVAGADAYELLHSLVERMPGGTASKAIATPAQEQAHQYAKGLLDDMKDSIRSYSQVLHRLGGESVPYIPEDVVREGANGTGRPLTHFKVSSFLDNWKSGNFFHKEAIFDSREEMQQFSQMLGEGLGHALSNDVDVTSKIDKSELKNAVAALAGRIFRQDLEASMAQAERIQREQRAAMRAQRREAQQQEAEAQRMQNLHTPVSEVKDKPYELQPTSSQIITHMAKYGDSQARNASDARFLVETLARETERLKTNNGDGVAALGGMLFSPSNLTKIVKSLDLEKQVPEQLRSSPAHSLNETASSLKKLYTVSEPAREVMDSLLSQSDGILLLAALTRPPERCRKYAQFVAGCEKRDAPLAAKNEAITNMYGAEEIKEFLHDPSFSNDPDIRSLKKGLEEREKIHQEVEAARLDLEQEVRRAFAGQRAKDIASADVPTLATVSSATALALVPKKDWEPVLKRHGQHLEEHEDGGKHVTVASDEFPYKNFAIKPTSSLTTLNRQVEELSQECKLHAENLALCATLPQDGFHFHTSEGGSTALIHPELGIHHHFDANLSEQEQLAVLTRAKGEFNEKMKQQGELLEQVRSAGGEVRRSSHGKGFDICSPNGDISATAPNGFLSEQGISQVESMLKKAEDKGIDTQKRYQPKQAPVVAKEYKPWALQENETLIIFDACTLSRLCASRGEDKSWMDLVKEVSKLPHTRVIVPGVVAEWELQGKIPTYDEAGIRTGSERIMGAFNRAETMLYQVGGASEKFFSSAAHARLQADGTVLSEEPHRKIMMMETPEDRGLYDKIRAIEASRCSNASGDRQTLETEIFKHDEGEKAIARILQGIGGKNAIVVTDDKAFLRDVMPKLNSHARPARCMNTQDFLKQTLSHAEHNKAIREGLKIEGSLEAVPVTAQIQQFWAPYEAKKEQYRERVKSRGIKPQEIQESRDHAPSEWER